MLDKFARLGSDFFDHAEGDVAVSFIAYRFREKVWYQRALKVFTFIGHINLVHHKSTTRSWTDPAGFVQVRSNPSFLEEDNG